MLKRYILFIVLSFLVFLLYPILFPSRPVKSPPPKEKPEEGTPATPTEGQKPPPEAPPEEAIRPTESIPTPGVTKEQRENEEKIWLENDYCRMRLTKFGAAIREMVLYTNRTKKDVVIQGEEAVEIPRKAVPDEGLNPLVITSSGGEGLDLSTHSFERKEESQRKAVYELALETGLTVTKSFELAKDDYLVTMEVVFENVSDKPLRVANHEIKVGTVFPQDARAGYRDIQFTVLGAGKAQKLKTNPKKTESESFDFVRWASAGNKYFALILSPERRKNKYKVIPEVGELAKEAGPAKKSSSKTEDSYFYSLGIGLEGFTLQPKVKIVHRYSFYAGPKEYDRLKRLSRKFSDDRQFEKVMRFGWFSFVGVPLLKVLKASYKVIPNYGLAIIFLTILIKVVLYPLDQKSYKSMKEMQKVQPLMAEIKKKYKDDPRRAQVEQMKLFKEHKVNPLGGCLPMLFQMPVLIAMFQMLRSAVELWRAPFVLWIKDLSQPDAVVDFHVELPLFGHFTLNILPLLLIGTFVLQTKVSKMGGSPSQQDPQQKAMGHMMTVVFGVIFYNMPSGLTLYFTVSTLLRLLQQYYVQKKG